MRLQNGANTLIRRTVFLLGGLENGNIIGVMIASWQVDFMKTITNTEDYEEYCSFRAGYVGMSIATMLSTKHKVILVEKDEKIEKIKKKF